MKNLAIIDIGSNSIKLVLVEIKKDNSFKIIDELQETVRLGAGMEDEKELKEDRINKAIKTLKMFKNLCNATATTEVIAVATAAVREAINQQKFLDKVKQEVGIEVQVLSGLKEGYYDYWGVANSINKDNGLIIDIGGGSIELVWMKNRQIKESISLPFGALNLTQRFNLYDSITPKQERDLKNFLHKTYKKISWLSNMNHNLLVGVGGTIKNIAKINQNQKDYPLKIIQNYQLKDKEVNNIYNLIKTKNLKERKKIKGLSKKRADIFIGASSVISVLMEFCNLKELLISSNGLREGLIYNYLCNDSQPIKDVLDFSINNIINNFNLNQKHAKHVYKLTKSLYEQLKGLLDFNNFNGDINKILKTATMLHDSGININYYNHHEHSFYMILNSGINGLSHRELLISAYIAASHRHTKYKLRKYNLNRSNFKDIIAKKGIDKKIIRKIGILLEIAESLDRNMNRIVKDVRCSINKNNIILKTISKDDVELEINDALSAAKGFKKLYGKKLIII